MEKVVLPVSRLLKSGVKTDEDKSRELHQVFKDDYSQGLKGLDQKFKHYTSDRLGYDVVNFIAESFGNLHAYVLIFGNELYGADPLMNISYTSPKGYVKLHGVIWANGAIMLNECSVIKPPTMLHVAIAQETYKYFNYPDPLILQKGSQDKKNNVKG